MDLVKDLEKVAKRQEVAHAQYQTQLDTLLAALVEARNATSQDAQQLTASTAHVSEAVKNTSSGLQEAQKEYYSAMSKYGKAVEKKFKSDLDAMWDPAALEGKEAQLHKAIQLHFIREGRFAVSGTFAGETGVPEPGHDGIQQRFVDMFRILEDLKQGKLVSAIAWAQEHREALQKIESSLEFQLHRLQFLNYVNAFQPDTALQYAKTTFRTFAPPHMKEIQRLMCSLLFASRLSKSPYKDFLDSNQQVDVQRQFTRDFCQLMGLSSESPLYVSVTVGASAIPTIIKMASIMSDKTGIEWTQQGELPVEIPLLHSQRFHSVFACPVSKEQATEANPPFMMACGHVIALESLTRLSKGVTNARFKCPYCPMENTAAQAQRIYF